MAIQVLDTSAIIAYLYDEPGADMAEQAIFGDADVYVPFMALMEVAYKFHRTLRDELEVEEQMAILRHWPVEIRESSQEWRMEAARVKAYSKVSMADSWMAALALLNDAELIHKDPEFDSVDGLKALKLPYDRDLAGSGA